MIPWRRNIAHSSFTGWISPLVKVTWLIIATRVRWVMARDHRSITSSALRAGTGSCTRVIVQLPRRAFISHGQRPPTCSWSVIRTSLSGSSSRPLATQLIASVVLRVNAKLLGGAPSSEPTAVRSAERSTPCASNTVSNAVMWRTTASTTGRGEAPIVPVLK